MINKIFLIASLSLILIGCQFTETMVLKEDGSGIMNVEMNMNEMMAFGGMGMTDSVMVKFDTIIYVKQFLEQKKDSISKLSKEEQNKLRKLENYMMHVKVNSETAEMIYDISTSFKNVNEANDILNGLEQMLNFMPNSEEELGNPKQEKNSSDIIGVDYSFEKGVFKRDAYIKDKQLHQQQVDSLKQSEVFLAGAGYTLKYTFATPIKRISDSQANLSSDKKTVILTKSFVDYFKNPDLLDLEVEIEE